MTSEQVQALCDDKLWSVGKGKTEVQMYWMSDNPNFVESTTVTPTRDLTDKQYDRQGPAIHRSIKKVLGWDAEAGISEHNQDGTENTGWHKIN